MNANWFIGLPVDPTGWFEPLVRSAPPCVRVFHPEDVHVTVAFLGACGQQLARQAWATVEHAEGAAMVVRLGGLEPMGNPRRPSALSVVLTEGQDPVRELVGALRTAAWAAAEARPDDRPPLPHLTVARPGRRATASERQRALEWARRQRPVGAQVVLDRIALYTWAEDRRIRQFRVVEQRRLESTAPDPAKGTTT